MDYRHLWQAEPIKQAPNVRKAFAYVTRRVTRGSEEPEELLVFAHLEPESGIQVPKGTVEDGETSLEAAIREVYEESGLRSLEVVGHLATDTVHFPNDPTNRQIQERHFFHLRAVRPTPQRWSHKVSAGEGDKGMTFSCFWLQLTEGHILIANMGDYLHLLR